MCLWSYFSQKRRTKDLEKANGVLVVEGQTSAHKRVQDNSQAPNVHLISIVCLHRTYNLSLYQSQPLFLVFSVQRILQLKSRLSFRHSSQIDEHSPFYDIRLLRFTLPVIISGAA